MNYLKIYESLIYSAQNRQTTDGYTELHHIIPKSIFASIFAQNLFNRRFNHVEDEQNKVLLYGREHALAHRLLVKIFEKLDKNCYIKMLYAAHFMDARNSIKYEWLKRRFSQIMRENMSGKESRAKGRKWSEASKQKRKDTHYMRGKKYEEIYGAEVAEQLKKHKSEKTKGRIVSNETKEKLRNSCVKTEEHKQKISLSKKGKPLSEEHKKKIRDHFSNPDTNPSVDQQLFTFAHDDGRVVTARKYEMKKVYGCPNPYKLISGKIMKSRGWRFVPSSF